jgi:hypothetical protein
MLAQAIIRNAVSNFSENKKKLTKKSLLYHIEQILEIQIYIFFKKSACFYSH